MKLEEFKIVKPKASDTMGIARDKMPQVKELDYPEYKSYLKDNGVNLKPEIVQAKDLKPMQKEFSDQGVTKQLNKNKEKGEGLNPKPLLASSDDYIIDGHHRWLAALNSGDPVRILRANVDGNELLSLTLKFPRVYFKDIYTENEEMDIIAKAEKFAQEAHKDHKRKYTGDPYYVHLDEVRNIVKQAGGTIEQQAAALLHDTVEDTNTTPMDITREFGPKIAKLVVELTDVSKPEDGNRKTRKAIDRDKLAGVSAEAQTVKYADLISNGKDIAQNDPKFAKVYHAEKADLLRVMTKGNQNLRKQAIALLPDELKSVVNEWVCGKCYAEPCKCEQVNEETKFPTISLKDLYHVGTLDASKKGDFSYEGNGLSVSTEPDAWRRIARGQVSGDTYTATKQNNTFLDTHKLTSQQNNQIKQWAIDNGFLEQQETVTVSWYDDEMDDTLSQTFNSMADAKAEHGDELEDYDVDIDKGGIVPTDKLKKATGQSRIEATGVLEYVLPLYAETLGLDGVWWGDDLDVNKLSAPRGVILPNKVKSWKFEKQVNEETPFGVVARKLGHAINKKAYINMAQMMHKILKRKYKETNGKLRHSLGYYAMMLAMQTNDKINWRELEQEYLGLYGNELFEGDIFEKWSNKYKKSINCSNPKGFSQKAHCAGRKKKESINEESINIKPIITPAIKKLDKIFKDNDYEVRIVGGAVRDIALGKEPKDIDFATDATPDEMMNMLDKAKVKTVPTGIEHGTITAVIDDEPFEITTLRADKETDGRRAEVEFVRSWEEDAKRRDLTYNAMSMDIDGNIYDYNGGMDDLQDKVSKFVGDPAERIKEDYLRILRYFRFQSKLDNPKWDEDTLNAIKDNVQGIKGLSVERIWQEMSKLLMSTNAEESLEWMNKTGVNQMIGLGGIKPSKLGEPAGPIISLAILLDNSNIAREWKMSKYDTEMLDFLIKHKGQNINPKQAKDMLVKGVSQDHLLAWANMHNKNDVYDTVHSFEKPEFPVNGKDLLAMGYRAGPQLGQLLTDLQDQWMKSNYKLSKEDLLKKVPVQESIVLEKVSRFMTGHGITYKGKKHDEMEVEVVGVDNEKRQYQVMIMRPEEYFGTNVMMSARFMHRGPWVKTKIPDYMGAFAKSDVKEWIYPAIQGAAHLARTYGPKIASKLMTDPAYKIAGAGTSGGGAAIGAYNYVKDKFGNKTKKQTKSSGGPSIPQAEMTEAEESKSEVFVDMDGVLVDFFTEWAKLMNVKTYRDIPKREIPKALKKIVDTPNFWENLPPLAGYKELLTAIKQMHGSYKILSSPLANDPNVDPGKREWVNKHLGFFKPEKVIIDHNKSQYAKQPDGTPNILIDDYGKNVNAWKQAGGVAIKHHTSTTNDTINQLKSILTNEVKEAAGVGRVIPGINTSVDVGPNEIIKQAKKFGNDVDKDGFPKKLLRTKKK
jgi:tRNA nucleotidyltransferase (CCA-adding enzyme)